MIIQTFPSGPLATNAYLLICPKTQQTAIIDPSPGSAATLSNYCAAHQLKPEKILITHSHWDHIADVAVLKKKFQIPVLVHSLDASNLEHPGSDGLQCWFDIEGVVADQFFKEGDIVPVGELKLTVIHTPGHSPGGVCFYCPEHHLLLSGDTLFKRSFGKLSLPTAQPHLMWGSLRKLAALPPETVVYPGHGPSTTIGKESWLADAEKIYGNEPL